MTKCTHCDATVLSSAGAEPGNPVQEALRLLQKISDLAYDEDVGEPLDCAIDYANKAIASLAAAPGEASCGGTPAVGGEALSIVRSAKYANPDPDASDQQIWNDACEHIEAGLLAAQPASPLREAEIWDNAFEYFKADAARAKLALKPVGRFIGDSES